MCRIEKTVKTVAEARAAIVAAQTLGGTASVTTTSRGWMTRDGDSIFGRVNVVEITARGRVVADLDDGRGQIVPDEYGNADEAGFFITVTF